MSYNKEYQFYSSDDFEPTYRKIQELVGNKKQVHEEIKSAKMSLFNYNRRVAAAAKAKTLIQKTAKEIQDDLGVHISKLVNLASASVFTDPYKIGVVFVERRGKTECDLLFFKDSIGKEPVSPEDSSGGGPLDVVSFALRCVFWAIDRKDRRPIMFLDEPFKFVSTNLHERCSQMLREVSKKLGMQVIMISHLPGIIKSADKIIGVKYKNGKSEILETQHDSIE